MRRRPIGGGPDVRRHNLGVVLHHLHVDGTMRRAELTDLTGLNRSTVSALVAELARLGAVAEEPGPAVGSGAVLRAGSAGKAGRPSPMVRTCPETVQVLAADVAVGRVVMALVGVGGTVLARRSRQVVDASAPGVSGLLAGLGRELLSSARAGRVIALGVAVPGVVRGSDGNVRFAPNLGWQDAPFGELLSTALAARGMPDLPVRIGNDGDLGALAEHRRGVARLVDDMVFIDGQVGVGGGVIAGGRPQSGAGGYAGELGHMTVRRRGRLCRCGARGCWETEIGSEAVARALGLPEGESEDRMVALLRSAAGDRDGDGTADPAVAAQLDRVAEYLGVGLANLVNLLNPRLIVLGGLLRELYPVVEGRVGRAISGAALRAPREQVRLAVPELGGDAVLLGAAEFAMHDLLTDPAKVLEPKVARC